MIIFFKRLFCKHQHSKKIKEITCMPGGPDTKEQRWITYYCPDCCKEWTKIED